MQGEDGNKKLTVALAQIPVTRDIDANEARIMEGIAYAERNGADILLTPEGSLSGYTHEFDAAKMEQALGRVERAAAQAGVGLALGTCKFEADGLCYNELRFYLPDGTYLGCHTKTLLCGTIAEPIVGEINHFATKPLWVFDFFNGITVGGLICNDMWANPGRTQTVDTHLSHRLPHEGDLSRGQRRPRRQRAVAGDHQALPRVPRAAQGRGGRRVHRHGGQQLPAHHAHLVHRRRGGAGRALGVPHGGQGQQFGVYTLEWEEKYP